MLDQLRERDKELFLTKSIEGMREAHKVCQRLFPKNQKPPEQGELLFIVRFGKVLEVNEEEIKRAGRWWLWARTLFIENTMTKEAKDLMKIIALVAAKPGGSIHLVSTRSPELLHAQIPNFGNPSLPRSREALATLADLSQKSEAFLPTKTTVLFADLAIDNLKAIIEAEPNIEGLIRENIRRLQALAGAAGLKTLEIRRLSSLVHPSGKRVGEIISPDGTPKTKVTFSPEAERKIEIVSNESLESHRRTFGWTDEQSKEHNRNIATTMALVGQAIKVMEPPAILIHNEAFIGRSLFNNLLNSQKDPLPVICLAGLLEKKQRR